MVFMAEQAEPVRRKVALKIIKPGMDSSEVIARFEAAHPPDEFRRGLLELAREAVRARRIVVTFDRRAHNPILREAHLDRACPPIPWLANRRVPFVYT